MPSDFSLAIERLPGRTPGTVILRLTGRLTLASVLALRAQFREFEPPPFMILDFAAVDYMDSAVMSEIINHEVYCRDKRVRLVVAGVTPRILAMFQITRLDRVLTLIPTVAEAEAKA
jgi:anti-anti-sigma factor